MNCELLSVIPGQGRGLLTLVWLRGIPEAEGSSDRSNRDGLKDASLLMCFSFSLLPADIREAISSWEK